MRRRRLLLAGLATVLVLALATAGLVVLKPGPVATWLGGADVQPTVTASPTAEPAPSPVLPGAAASAPMPTPAGLRAVLDPLIGAAGLGSRVNISVADLTSGDSLYGRQPDAGTVPASVTKLVTAVTVLAARGPAHRIPTVAVAGPAAGEVVLIGGGDPTLAAGAESYYPSAARLDELAAQVERALGGVQPSRVIVDSTLFSGPLYGPGWDDDVRTGYGGPISALMIDGARLDPRASHSYAQRSSAPDLAAGRAFAEALGLPPSAVVRGRAPAGSGSTAASTAAGSPGAPDSGEPGTGPATGSAGSPTSSAGPAPGVELGRVESPPMIRLVDIMVGQSDNVVAEALARQVAIARRQPASFAGAAAAMRHTAAELGLPTAELRLADGSGLSRNNRISPSLLTDLLVLAAQDTNPHLRGLFASLPVGGWSGTLHDRYENSAARGAGVVRAKTGTLSGVHAISGVLTTGDGRPLAFAIMADRVPTAADPQPALDRIAAALVGCGCR